MPSKYFAHLSCSEGHEWEVEILHPVVTLEEDGSTFVQGSCGSAADFCPEDDDHQVFEGDVEERWWAGTCNDCWYNGNETEAVYVLLSGPDAGVKLCREHGLFEHSCGKALAIIDPPGAPMFTVVAEGIVEVEV